MIDASKIIFKVSCYSCHLMCRGQIKNDSNQPIKQDKTPYIPLNILQFVMPRGLVILISRSRAIELAGDGVGHVGQLLLLLLEVLGGGFGSVVLEPVSDLLDGVQDGLLVVLINLATQAVLIVDLVLQAEGIILQRVAGLDLALDGLVLLSELFGLSDHAVDLLLGETTLVVGDGDGLSLASALVAGADLQDTVGVQIEGDLNLGNTTGSGGNAGKLELAEEVVILGQGTLALIYDQLVWVARRLSSRR